MNISIAQFRLSAPKTLTACLPYLPAAFIAVLFIATVALTWTGIGPGDVMEYSKTALSWLNHGPVLGETHWSLRLPLVAPIAASYALFGPGEFTTTLPNILYAGGLVATTFVFARKYFGRRAGLITSALVATSAFLMMFQIDVRVFGPELFFTVLATWLFIDALMEKAGAARFFLIGFIAAFAWLCRENAIFLPVSLGLILLFRRPFPWGAIIAFSAGFGSVVLVELVVYGVVSGDPLYRYMIDLHHNTPKNSSAMQSFVEAGNALDTRPAPLDRFKRPFGQLMTTTTVTPFFLLAALVSVIPHFRRRFLRESRPRMAFAVFGISSLMSYVMSGSVMNLTAPFYFPQLVYTFFLILGAFAAYLFDIARPRLAMAFIAGVVVLNAAAEDFRSYDEYAEPRWLANLVESGVYPITTDGLTARRTRMFLTFKGLSQEEAAERVPYLAADEPPPGAFVSVATPLGAKPALAPQPGWTELANARVRKPRWTHELLGAIGADHWGSYRLAEIVEGAPPVALYATSKESAEDYRQMEETSRSEP